MYRAGDCKLQQALLLMTPLSVLQNVVTATLQKQQASWHTMSNVISWDNAVNLSLGLSFYPSCHRFKMAEENQYLYVSLTVRHHCRPWFAIF